MSRTRIQREQAFHDQQARERATYFAQSPDKLLFTDEEYLNHESWIRPAIAQLGEVEGKDILDLGCGHGMASIVLARRGASVTALDLSGEYVRETKSRADANDVSLKLIHANAQQIPFADSSFDGIWGHAILHHLDLEQMAKEIHRVLRPGGVAVFCEPWGENPFLRWARRRLPYRGKGHTPDEMPLRQRDVTLLRRHFEHLEVKGFQLLSMMRRALPITSRWSILDHCDRFLLRTLPLLQRFCRYVVLTIRV